MADAKGAYIGGVPVQFKDAAARAMISDEYNSAETYAKGNLCIYNGKIYEAIKETTGTWDATAWEETTLAKVNGKLNGDIASLTEKAAHKPNFSAYFIHNAWTTILLNPNENVLLIGHLVGNNSAMTTFFCYLIAAGATESNTGEYYKIAGSYEPTLNWNNGLSIGIYASDTIWMQCSVLHI